MDRNPDGAGLISHRPSDRLPNPPGSVRAELEAAPVIELFDRSHQAEVAFLNQVQHRQAAPEILLGDAHHQPKIGLDEATLRALALGTNLPPELVETALH